MAKVENICRLCTKNTTSTVCLNHNDTDKVSYIDKLKFIFSDLVLEQDSITPFLLCPVCCKKLKQTYDFKQLCTTSYKYWQLHFQNNKPLDNVETKIKVEPIATPKRGRGRPRKIQNLETPVNQKVTSPPKLNVSNLKNKLGAIMQIKSEPIEPDNDNKPNSFKLGANQIKSEPVEPDNDNKPNSFTLGSNQIKSEPIDIKPNIFKLKNKLNTLLKPEADIPTKPAIQLNFLSLKNKLGDALKNSVEYIEEKKVRKMKPKKKSTALRKYYYTNNIYYIIDTKNKKYYCNLCKKFYYNFNGLKDHISRDLRLKTIFCHLCNKQFFYANSFRIHLKTMHKSWAKRNL